MQSHRKRSKLNSLFIISYLVISISISQSEVYDGLTLITSKAGGGGSQQNETHLIDNEHNILNSRLHNTSPASIPYLFPDSILFVPCCPAPSSNPPLAETISKRLYTSLRSVGTESHPIGHGGIFIYYQYVLNLYQGLPNPVPFV